MEDKICKHCQEIKPVTEFVKIKDRQTGYAAQCKACRRIWSKAYRTNVTSREKVLKSQAAYRLKMRILSGVE